MGKACLILDQSVLLDDERFIAHVKVFAVVDNLKYPDGYKVRCALVEKNTRILWVLLDNHDPYGYHLHAKLPQNKNFRVSVEIQGYEQAIELFFKEVERVINEKK